MWASEVRGIESDFPNCVRIADETLFPLAFEPETADAPDHSGRKYGFSITTMIICDYNKKIRYYLAGYPGSCHDNRVYNNTGFVKKPQDYFLQMECNMGDSAFANSPYMVSSFRKAKGELLEPDNESLNTKLAKLRIHSEHCIDILKGRFPWLRSIWIKVTDDPKSMRRILRLLDATIILHNMLIVFCEEETKNEMTTTIAPFITICWGSRLMNWTSQSVLQLRRTVATHSCLCISKKRFFISLTH